MPIRAAVTLDRMIIAFFGTFVPSAPAWTFASLTPSISFALIGVVMAIGIEQLETRRLRWRPEYRKGG